MDFRECFLEEVYGVTSACEVGDKFCDVLGVCLYVA